VGRVASVLDATARALTSWLALTLLISVAPGLAVWPLAHHEELGYVVENNLDADLRVDVLYAMAYSSIVVLAFYIAVHMWLRMQGRAGSVPATFRALNRYMFVLLAFPAVTTLMSRGIERDHYIFTMALVALVTGMFSVFIYRAHDLAKPRTAPRPTEPNTIHWIFVAGAFTFYAGVMSYLAVLDHRNLGTHIYDLGIYDNIFWQTAYDEFLGCSYCKLGSHVSAHFDPIIYVFSFVYRLAPNAETLLWLQSTWLATTVFPLFLLAQRRLGNPRLAAGLCWIFTLYPPLHGVNMFDFHSLTMVVPTLVWMIYFIDSGSKILIWVGLAFTCMTREDMPLLACFLGAYAMMCRRTFTGLLMVVLSLAYLAFVKMYMMPDPGLLMSSKETMSYAYFFEQMIPYPEEGIRGFITTLLTNPTYALQVLFTEERIFFFLVLLQPLLFLPLLGGKKRFMMLYGLLFLGLATRKYVFDLHFQYSSVLFPILWAAVPDGIARATESRVGPAIGLERSRIPTTLVWSMFVAMALTSVKYGGMLPNEHFKAGWNRLSRRLDEERYEYLQELLAQIPEDAAVCASSSLGPHVSARKGAHKWPACHDSDYALIMIGRFKKKDERRLKRLLRTGRLVVVDESEEHDFGLYEYQEATKPEPQRPNGGRKPESKEDREDGVETEGLDPADMNPHLRDPEDLEKEQESRGVDDEVLEE
jgi:uncharacterized membrane protein